MKPGKDTYFANINGKPVKVSVAGQIPQLWGGSLYMSCIKINTTRYLRRL